MGRRKKLEALKTHVSKDCYDMFHNLSATTTNAGEELQMQSLKPSHVRNLTERFEIYFPADDDPRKATGWNLNLALKDNLITVTDDELSLQSVDKSLQMTFEICT